MSRLREAQAAQLKATISQARNVLRWGLFGTSILSVIGCAALAVLVCIQLQNVPDLGFLEHYHPVDAIEIYDKNDALVCAVIKLTLARTCRSIRYLSSSKMQLSLLKITIFTNITA